MTRHLMIACTIYLALILQPSISANLGTVSIQPWLPGLALTTCLLLAQGATRFIWVGLLALGVDGISGDKMGVHVVVATLVAISLSLFRTDDQMTGLANIVMFAFIATFVWLFAAAITHGFIVRRPVELEQLVIPALGAGLSTAVMALMILGPSRLLKMTFRSQRTSSLSLANRWSMLTGG